MFRICSHSKYFSGQDIDHEAVANTALKTKLKKDKKLSEDADLEAAIAKELVHLVAPVAPGSNLAKVQGRLLSSKALATEVHSVVGDIKVSVFPELKKPAAPDTSSEDESDGDSAAPPVKKAKLSTHKDQEEGSSSQGEDGSDEESLGKQVVLDEDDEAVDDGGWESGSVNSGPDVSSDEESETSGDEGSGNEGEGEKSSGGEANDGRPPREARHKVLVGRDTTKNKSTGESTFLPSLSVGFTRGDSDASDLDDAEVTKADVVKKNRRGQRARQA